MDYQDKVVIVTGGSKGIGEGCVRVFVEAGAKVVFCAVEPYLHYICIAPIALRVSAEKQIARANIQFAKTPPQTSA